jgi:hypothetical protein
MRIRVGVYDLTLEIKGVGSSRKVRKGKITQSAQGETYRVFQSSQRSLRASHSALSARDEVFTQSPQCENKKPDTSMRRVFIIVGMNYFTIKRCVA